MKMNTRGSGLLLHVTSLPSRFGIGDIGPAAYRFVDLLAETRQRYWQILPLNPTDPEHDHSPYSSTSAFALNPLLVSPELLAEDGLVDAAELELPEPFPEDHVDFERVITFKEGILFRVYDRFMKERNRWDFERFNRENAWWLDDFALYTALRADFDGLPWNRWPDDLRTRRPEAIRNARERLRDRIDRVQFIQYLLAQQWEHLRRYCHDRDIRIIGDMPMYVDYHSAEVWTHPEFFQLDDEMQPQFVAGVPPDYFNSAGQLWGTPVYRWDALQKSGFALWVLRLKRALEIQDYVRIDHFRGFVAFWKVPAGAQTAIMGMWSPAPARDLLNTVVRKIPCLPVIAEDLGTIDEDVRKVMQEFAIPGMRVLIIAFEEGFARSLNIPHNVAPDSVLYTGTHDTNTVRGWIEEEATEEQRHGLRQYFGLEIPAKDLSWVFVRLAMSTVADTVVIPVQDLLGLGSGSRMNRPGTLEGNWRWRVSEGMLTPELRADLLTLTRTYARD